MTFTIMNFVVAADFRTAIMLSGTAVMQQEATSLKKFTKSTTITFYSNTNPLMLSSSMTFSKHIITLNDLFSKRSMY